MKGVRLKALGIALLGALGLLFAGCGQQGQPTPQTGTLQVTVQDQGGSPIQGAQVSVQGQSGTQLTDNQGKASFTLPAGTYTVTATKQGYNPGSTQATVTAGQTTTATITLTQPSPPSGYRIGSIELLSGYPKDASGLLPLSQEENPQKEVNLYAAQTEEPICFRFQVKDEQGNPVGEGVRVKVESFEYGGVTVDVSFGCEPNLQGRDYGYTDAQGRVYFTVNALYSNLIQGFLREPVKFTAVATDERTQTSARTEFKVWFFNISHLYFAHQEGIKVGGEAFFTPQTGQLAPTRKGHDFGTITNIFSQNRDLMAHTFTSFVRPKQPDGEPIYPGVEGLPWVANSTYEMVYTLVGGDVNDVQWVAGCDTGSTATTCIDSDGSGVALNLKPTVTLQDLPKQVQIKATMRVSVVYGNSTYTFDLKDYTFTKQWVGAYLTVEKYVDNHVLTWYGPDRTLPASSTTFDANYTSTVHIKVTNPSQSPMYNVTIRDALPPELGVVTSSIDNNGTYDPSNHVVTWNYSQFTALQQMDPGESVEVTFQVYVRQKPGFCGDASLVGPNYVVPALYGAVGYGPNCTRPYDDPYKVTNGLAQNDVTASGFLGQGGTGTQLVFDYTPVADESDIWAVRPIFAISKTLKTASPITQGASALFEIAVTHVDRTVGEAAYGALKAKYPWEFGNDTKGSGHRSATYKLRTNTYAHDVEVTDAFEVGLDFTDASDFSGAGLISGGVAQAYNPVVGKRFGWSKMSLQAGSTVTANIFLTGNLLTPQGQRWDNCAFLGASQLNQPADVTGTAYTGAPYVPGAKVWSQDQLTAASQVTGTDGTFTTDPALADSEVSGRIHSCAGVGVVPPPPSPYLSLTSHGEYNGGVNGPDPFVAPSGSGSGYAGPVTNTNPGGTPTEGIPVNTTFWYKGTIFNTGQADAQGVTYTATLTGTTFVNFINNPNTTRIYIIDSTGAVVGNLAPTAINATSVTFSGFNIPKGGLARVVIEAKGVAAGQQEYFRQEVTYSNNTYPQPLPLVTQETTTIAP